MTKGTKIFCGALALFGLLLFSAVALVGHFVVGYKRGERHFETGYAAAIAGRYHPAIREFTKALRCPLRPSLRSYVLGNRGYCEARDHHPREAMSDLTAALRLNDKLAFAYTERGALRAAQGDNDGAWEDYSRAIALDPNAGLAFMSRGLIADRRQQWDAAILDFSEAIRTNPAEPAGYVYRGDAYARQQKFSEALASFESTVRVAPGYAPGYLYRGYLYHQRHDLYKAIADYSAALRIAPDLAEAYWGRIRAYVEKKDWRGAIGDYSELLRLNPRDEVALQARGLAYGLANDRSSALSDFTELIRITQSRQAYELRAGILMLQGKYQDALADYRTALQQAGPYGLAKSLAWLLATCPDPKFRSAEEAVARATEDCVRTDWQNANYIDTLAAAYAETGDLGQAATHEEQALANKQIDADARAAYEVRLALYRSGFPYRDTGKHVPPKRSPTPSPLRPRP